MRKWLISLIGMLLVLTLTASAAAADFAVTRVSDAGNGNTMISWNASSNGGPYHLQLQHGSSGVNWYYTDSSTYNTTAYMTNILPGHTYRVSVEDGAGKSTAQYSYTAPYRTFNEFGINIGFDLKTKVNGKISKKLGSFSASDIQRNMGSTSYGAYIKLNYSRLKKARNYYWVTAVGLPDDDVYVTGQFQDDLPAGVTYYYWTFYDLTSFFNAINRAKGYIPVGNYTWNLYFDGQYVSSASFTVNP